MSGAPVQVLPLDDGAKAGDVQITSSVPVEAMEASPDVHTVAMSMLILKNTALERTAATGVHVSPNHSKNDDFHAGEHIVSGQVSPSFHRSTEASHAANSPSWDESTTDDQSNTWEQSQLYTPTQLQASAVSMEETKAKEKSRRRYAKRSPVFVFCQVSGCTKAATNVTKGLCTSHFKERTEDTPSHDRHTFSMREKVGDLFVCTYPECTKGARSKGLCKRHGGGKRCSVFDCPRSDQGGGLCIKHGGGRRCGVEGCKNSSQSRGLCKRHGGVREDRGKYMTSRGVAASACPSVVPVECRIQD
ncbi:hypothetical protein H257_03695 [Aphanomyces astaci]|uniref:WRKY19-like zinc finger domain-containing protein n=2 Tax=Aphanomyces astaci TaxID=112090 RepID=W4GZR4_APHAT|nr:hypothetical protein H257_03695 [Aphanomyces astaci]ETV84509.1 hypothetical protein H257_03695 [Aphanomyces astaci]|eukprot:XP_009826201.1 hypothetical protein H257_03695 [Aphanomyces astaci]